MKFQVKSELRARFLIVLVSVCLSSCMMVVLKMSGNIKNPKLETNEKIKKYSEKEGDPFDILWVANSTRSFEELITRYPGMPTVLIYDKSMNVLENSRGEECQKMLINFFNDSLKFKYIKVQDSSYSFLKQRVKAIENKSHVEKSDYIVVYLWVKWTPKITKDIFERLKKIKEKKNYDICFISLNKDWHQDLHEKAPYLKNKIVVDGSASAPKR